MKKLMIALAAAAMVGGAFAEEDPCTAPCPFGYQFKTVLKTTSAQVVSNSVLCTGFCLRGPASVRLAGFIYGTTDVEDDDPCGGKGCACNEWAGAKLLLWNYDTKAAAMPQAASISVLDRIISRKGDTTMVEIAFDLDDLRFAGFGYVAKRNGKWTIKNLAGFCAGQLSQKCIACSEVDPCTGACTQEDESAVLVWGICDNESATPEVVAEKTAAYGKWTIDWSATVYNKVENKASLIPTGFQAIGEGIDFNYAN